MKELNDDELVEVSGGSIKVSVGVGLIIGGIVTFIIGVVNGFVSTNKTCNTK